MAHWVKDLALLLQRLGSLLWCRFRPWPGNFHTLWVSTKKKKKAHKRLVVLYMNVHSSFHCDSPQMETTKMSFNGWMVRQSGTSMPRNRSSSKKEWTSDTYNNYMDSSRGVVWSEKKPISKGHMLHDFIYMTFSKWQNCTDGELISGCQGLRRRGGLGGEEGRMWP